MDRLEIEKALTELRSLLGGPAVSENAYQAWFERNPVIFTALGYNQSIPHPRLNTSEGELFVPDFLVEDMKGIWHCFELKLPDTQVHKKVKRRQTFYAEFESYLSQCRDYAEFFKDSKNRDAFKALYFAKIQPDVHSVIVAGRRSKVDAVNVHKLLFDRGAKVSHYTYDDIATQLELLRAQLHSSNENNPGLSIHLVAVLEKQSSGDNYILDCGLELNRNRVSIYISPDDILRFRVIDRDGNERMTSVLMKKANIRFNSLVYLVCELGFTDDYTFTCVEVNGEHYSDRRHDQFIVDPEAINWYVQGSDVIGKEQSKFTMIELAVCTRSLKFSEKIGLQGYFLDRINGINSGWEKPLAPKFSGNQFLCTEGHPNFLNRGP